MQIYDILKEDHEKVLGLLDDLIALEEGDDFRMVLVEQIAGELIPHARSEEAVFYNSIRAVSPDSSVVMHSYKEHMEAESLLRMLQVKDRADFDWRGTAEKLRDSLKHHISEEEGKVFSEGQKVFNVQEAEKLGEAFEKLKEKVSQQGFTKNSLDLVINLMPPKLAQKLQGVQHPDIDIGPSATT